MRVCRVAVAFVSLLMSFGVRRFETRRQETAGAQAAQTAAAAAGAGGAGSGVIRRHAASPPATPRRGNDY